MRVCLCVWWWWWNVECMCFCSALCWVLRLAPLVPSGACPASAVRLGRVSRVAVLSLALCASSFTGGFGHLPRYAGRVALVACVASVLPLGLGAACGGPLRLRRRLCFPLCLGLGLVTPLLSML